VNWSPAHELERRRLLSSFVAIFAMAFLVRFVAVLLFAVQPINDLFWNDAVGWNLASGHGFTASQHDPRTPGIFRTPGYPALLALVYSLFGHSRQAVYVVQAVLDSGSAVLIGIIALRVTTRRIAILASVLYALYPYAAFFCGTLHQDILLTFATLVVLLLVVEVSRTGGGAGAWAIVGVATGLTALVKPNFMLFTAVPALVIWFAVPRARRPAIATVALALGVLLAVTPWVVRNYVVFRAFPPLAAGGTGTNLMLLIEELDGGEQRLIARFRPPETDQARYMETFVDGHAMILNERELARVAGVQLLGRWPEYLVLIAYHVPRLWITRYPIGYSSALGVTASVLSWPLVALGLGGMWLARRDWPRNLPLYLAVFVITAMYAPYTAEARYTLPARPAMLVFVAYALLAGANLWRLHTGRRAAMGA
jgi:4-amino-4-deoxy-L-arabinose transferase-like glycosyltransferase